MTPAGSPGPPPERPIDLPPAPAELGGLGPPLRRLAAMQGAWPPSRPTRIVWCEDVDGMSAGGRQADTAVDAGADLIVAAGGGGDSAALTVLAAILGLEPVAVVGTTASPGWALRISAVRDGLRAVKASAGDPQAILTGLGADRLAGLAGVITRAAARRTPVLLSGTPAALAAALVASRMAPEVKHWLIAGCSPKATASRAALADLALEPVLDLRLDDPAGAGLALGVLAAGIDLAGSLHQQTPA